MFLIFCLLITCSKDNLTDSDINQDGINFTSKTMLNAYYTTEISRVLDSILNSTIDKENWVEEITSILDPYFEVYISASKDYLAFEKNNAIIFSAYLPIHNNVMGVNPRKGTNSLNKIASNDPIVGTFNHPKIFNNKVLFWAPMNSFESWDVYEDDIVNQMADRFPEVSIDYLKDANADIDALTKMNNYSVVVLSTHGSAGNTFISGDPLPEEVKFAVQEFIEEDLGDRRIGFNSNRVQDVVVSQALDRYTDLSRFDLDLKEKNLLDYWTKGLVRPVYVGRIKEDATLGISEVESEIFFEVFADFVGQQVPILSQTTVIMDLCDGMLEDFDNNLKKAFFDTNKAMGLVGYTDIVYASCSAQVTYTILESIFGCCDWSSSIDLQNFSDCTIEINGLTSKNYKPEVEDKLNGSSAISRNCLECTDDLVSNMTGTERYPIKNMGGSCWMNANLINPDLDPLSNLGWSYPLVIPPWPSELGRMYSIEDHLTTETIFGDEVRICPDGYELPKKHHLESIISDANGTIDGLERIGWDVQLGGFVFNDELLDVTNSTGYWSSTESETGPGFYYFLEINETPDDGDKEVKLSTGIKELQYPCRCVASND